MIITVAELMKQYPEIKRFWSADINSKVVYEFIATEKDLLESGYATPEEAVKAEYTSRHERSSDSVLAREKMLTSLRNKWFIAKTKLSFFKEEKKKLEKFMSELNEDRDFLKLTFDNYFSDFTVKPLSESKEIEVPALLPVGKELFKLSPTNMLCKHEVIVEKLVVEHIIIRRNCFSDGETEYQFYFRAGNTDVNTMHGIKDGEILTAHGTSHPLYASYDDVMTSVRKCIDNMHVLMNDGSEHSIRPA